MNDKFENFNMINIKFHKQGLYYRFLECLFSIENLPTPTHLSCDC